jgi:hypothetical protein
MFAKYSPHSLALLYLAARYVLPRFPFQCFGNTQRFMVFQAS